MADFLLFLILTLLAITLPVLALWRHKIYILPIVILVPLLSFCFYQKLGSYALVKSTRLQRQLGTPAEVIARMQAHLLKHPNSAQGWYLLGRLYASQGDFQAAEQSLRKAVKLEPHNSAYVDKLHEVEAINKQKISYTE